MEGKGYWGGGGGGIHLVELELFERKIEGPPPPPPPPTTHTHTPPPNDTGVVQFFKGVYCVSSIDGNVNGLLSSCISKSDGAYLGCVFPFGLPR